eukprot:gene18129-21082_t
MNDEYSGFTGETAVTYNQEFDGHFSKYRRVEAFTHDNVDHLALFTQSTPFYDIHQATKAFPSSSSKKLRITVPPCLPGSKTEVTPQSPVYQAPRCPEKPCFLAANTSFLASEANYEKVKDSVERALMMLEDYD